MGKAVKAIIVVLVLGTGAYLLYHYLGRIHEEQVESALEKERIERQAETEELQQKIAGLEEELARKEPTPVPAEKMTEVFGEPEVVPLPEREDVPCEVLEKRVEAFFSYLNKQDYMASLLPDKDAYQLFEQTVADLAANPPLVTGEMKDLYSLILNVAHFYRVLGKARIDLVKTVLEEESQIIESAMENLFAWLSACDRCGQAAAPCPSLEVLYEYAGFFLNTLAGRSYLLRRDGPVRILTTYYSVLIIDRANEGQVNPHGIDIRPYINLTLYDMENQTGLVSRKRYVERLSELKRKYRM
jgi:hypothetical protein